MLTPQIHNLSYTVTDLTSEVQLMQLFFQISSLLCLRPKLTSIHPFLTLLSPIPALPFSTTFLPGPSHMRLHFCTYTKMYLKMSSKKWNQLYSNKKLWNCTKRLIWVISTCFLKLHLRMLSSPCVIKLSTNADTIVVIIMKINYYI
jgi:hypothetical protein